MKKTILGLCILLNTLMNLHADEGADKLKRRVVLIQPKLLGWCSEEKSLNFVDLALQVKPKICVEIGVFGGASLIPTACTLKFLEEGIVIGIDPWETDKCLKNLNPIDEKEHVEWWSKVDLNDILKKCLEALLLYDLEKYCKILKMTSENAASEITSIDILHIDGHRSEEQTVQDVQLYLPKVVTGGYIWMGDTLSYNKQKGIDLLLEQCDVIKIIDSGSCILFRKR